MINKGEFRVIIENCLKNKEKCNKLKVYYKKGAQFYMKNKVALLTDTSSGLTYEQAKEYGIYLVSLSIIVDGKEFEDQKEISTKDFLEYQANKCRTSTSLPAPGKVYEQFNQLMEEYDQVLYIPISSKLSGTYVSGCTLAREFEGRVLVVDCLRIATPLKLAVLEAKKMLECGYSANKVKEILETSTENDDIFILTETLEYLKRGGRISPTIAAVGNLLKIKPVLRLHNGEIGLAHKVRTQTKAYQIILEELDNVLSKNKDAKIIVLHYHHEPMLERMIPLLKERFTEHEIIIDEVGAIILNHTGKEVIGVGVHIPLI